MVPPMTSFVVVTLLSAQLIICALSLTVEGKVTTRQSEDTRCPKSACNQQQRENVTDYEEKTEDIQCPKKFKLVNGECEPEQQDNIVRVPTRCPSGMGLAANGRCVSQWGGK